MTGVLNDGEAMLLALVRRKGHPAALADWLLERVPAEFSRASPVPAVRVASRGVRAEVWWVSRIGTGAWVRLVFGYTRRGRPRLYLPTFHLDFGAPALGRSAGSWLSLYLNETFIRRRYP